MVRTQIQLTEAQYRQLKRWAARLEISLAEAVRRCVQASLSRPEHGTERDQMLRQAFAVAEKYSDPQGPSRVAKDHDAQLAKVYGR